MIIGIDPGNSGAMVLLDSHMGLRDHLIMPLVVSGKRFRPDILAIHGRIRHWMQIGQITESYIEKTGVLPGNGSVGMFTFGFSAGALMACTICNDIDTKYVTPQEWKKSFNLIGSDKDAARLLCQSLYPTVEVLNRKGKGQAVSDAILIARYGAASHGNDRAS